ncbi:unnamed protein product, partial [Brassica rapa]
MEMDGLPASYPAPPFFFLGKGDNATSLHTCLLACNSYLWCLGF